MNSILSKGMDTSIITNFDVWSSGLENPKTVLQNNCFGPDGVIQYDIAVLNNTRRDLKCLTRWEAAQLENFEIDSQDGPFIFLLIMKSSKALHTTSIIKILLLHGLVYVTFHNKKIQHETKFNQNSGISTHQDQREIQRHTYANILEEWLKS